MSQENYIVKILRKFGMENCKPRGTPCELNPNACDSNEPVDNHKYWQMAGSLAYAMVCTTPDINYLVTKLSQHLSYPTTADISMLKHVFRYLKKTIGYKLTFSKTPDGLHITAYCDADWAASSEDSRSISGISGYCISLHPEGPPIFWRSTRQNSVALSTCEAEYVAMSIACQEAIYLRRNLLQDMLNDNLSSVLYSDNQIKVPLRWQRTLLNIPKQNTLTFASISYVNVILIIWCNLSTLQNLHPEEPLAKQLKPKDWKEELFSKIPAEENLPQPPEEKPVEPELETQESDLEINVRPRRAPRRPAYLKDYVHK
eukprot:gene20863-22915_t